MRDKIHFLQLSIILNKQRIYTVYNCFAFSRFQWFIAHFQSNGALMAHSQRTERKFLMVQKQLIFTSGQIH